MLCYYPKHLMMKVYSIGASSALWSMIRKQIKPAVMMFLLLTVLVGIVYLLVVTGIAQVIFPAQANGDLIVHNGNIAGSSLIGQPFSSPDYFWGRLSATSPVPYDAEASGGSNYGPQNPALITEVQGRIDALHTADPNNTQPIPVDLVTSSGSGLDPDINPVRPTTRSQGLHGSGTFPKVTFPCLLRQTQRTRCSGSLASRW